VNTSGIVTVVATLLGVLLVDLTPGRCQEPPSRMPLSTGVRAGGWESGDRPRVARQPGCQPGGPWQGYSGVPYGGSAVPGGAYMPGQECAPTDPGIPTVTLVPLEPARPESRWQFFGDFLYLQAGDANMAYAVPTNGAIVPPAGVAPLQLGAAAAVIPDFAPGFRVGLSGMLFSPARIGASYTYFWSDASSTLSVNPPDVNDSLVIHPGTEAALPVFLDAQATGRIGFQLADVDYRAPLASGEGYVLYYVLGGRYAHLHQDFHATFFDSGTIEDVNTKILFDGGGIRVGLDGERVSPTTGFLVYARGGASFLAGRFNASYSQVDNFNGTLVDTGLSARRIVPILDLELGAGWTGLREHLRLTAGYMVNAWYNVITTGDLINAVQNNRFTGLSNTLTFDGLVTRAELRF